MNILEKRIKNNKSYIKRDKKNLMLVDMYKATIKENEKVLKLLKTNKMTPFQFEKLSHRMRWDVAPLLKKVKWLCRWCRSDQGNETPKMMFMGERYCSYCNNQLTRRTGGGQSDPFNYTFKKIK